MSDVKVSLTQAQYILLMRLLQSIPRVLASAPDAEEAAERSSKSPMVSRTPSSGLIQAEPAVDMNPELSLIAHADSGQEIRRWNTVDLVFSVDAVRLQLFDKHATRETTLKDSGIVRLSLNESTIRFKSLSDSSTETEVILKSVTINNTRACNSKFREIIPAAQHDRNQFMLLFTTTAGTTPSSNAVVSIDSPKVIFAVDPVFALLDMFQSPFQAQSHLESEEPVDAHSSEAPQPGSTAVASSSSAIRVDLHDVSVSVLEKDDDPNTQAIQLTIKEIMMSQQVSIRPQSRLAFNMMLTIR